MSRICNRYLLLYTFIILYRISPSNDLRYGSFINGSIEIEVILPVDTTKKPYNGIFGGDHFWEENLRDIKYAQTPKS